MNLKSDTIRPHIIEFFKYNHINDMLQKEICNRISLIIDQILKLG